MPPFRNIRARFLAYSLLEGGLIFGVLYGLAMLTLRWAPDLGPTDRALVSSVAAAAVLFSIILFGTKWANLGEAAGALREVVVFGVVSVMVGLITFGLLRVILGGQRQLSSILFLEGAVAVPAAVGLWRLISSRFGALHPARQRVLILGTGETAMNVARWIGEHPTAGYSVLGFADEDERRLGTVLAMGARIQTDYASLPRFAPRRVDRVIVALDEKRGKLPLLQLMELRLRGLVMEEATTFIERVSGRIAVESMLPSWLIFSDGFKISPFRSVIKRACDLFHSVLLLIVVTPLMLFTAILIKLESRGPVLYRQTRLGMAGHEFDLLKFRSMRHDAEGESGPVWAKEHDERVTRVGWIIRKLRMDELPQLFNVIKGEMSFVGPRPERDHFIRHLERRIPYYGLRMTVRPGITGWAQVEYGYGATDEESLEKLKYDLFYIKNSNLLLDLWIVLKTVKVVLLGSGAR